eukprot:jgi/Picre1/27809/NNA_000773.t1
MRGADKSDIKDFSEDFVVVEEPEDSSKTELDRETDPHRISQRQRQIDFGKNTIGYQRYLEQHPKHKRSKGLPRTPDVYQKCSKRAFDGQVRKWRRRLHDWDLPDTSAANVSASVDVSPGVATDSGSHGSKNGKQVAVGKGKDKKLKKGTLPRIFHSAPVVAKRERGGHSSPQHGKECSESPMLPDLKLGRWADLEDDYAMVGSGNQKSNTTIRGITYSDVVCHTPMDTDDVQVSYSEDEQDAYILV